ncbi:four-carbon acid sugar kinase family protein [Microbacterium sp. NPDC089189]|uniref:four-carbon acid sugar kinase family protein n=1 Tax=Microbacterium sp. NPDC089189 TaxID=3154972 RepID=UPI00342D9BCC
MKTAPRSVGLVADDLTGAADAAVGFAEAGWRTEIVLDVAALASGTDSDDRPVLLAVDAETRHMGFDDARSATATVVSALRTAGAERLFLKIDSTMRGSVSAQVEGGLDSWSRSGAPATAAVCPAFPAHGRVVVDGELLVDGRPVHLSPAADDPVAPVTMASMSVLVPAGTRASVEEVGAVPIALLDARTDEDLEGIAAVLAEVEASVVAVGSGGLSAALATRWQVGAASTPQPTAPGVLFAVSSLHPVSRAQVAHVRSRLGAHDDLVLAPDELLADAAAAVEVFASEVAEALARRPFGALVLVGGDGAAAVLRRLRAQRVVIGAQVLRGCPSGAIAGGAADALTIVTKSGGFGDPTTLSTLLDLLGTAAQPASLTSSSSKERP